MTDITTLNDLIVDSIRDRKGRSITIVDLEAIPGASARSFIIAEGSSVTQVAAIADHLRDRLLDDAGLKPYNSDGRSGAEWMVLDYGDVWVHIFLPEARQRYNLEDLWNDATITNLPDLD